MHRGAVDPLGVRGVRAGHPEEPVREDERPLVELDRVVVRRDLLFFRLAGIAKVIGADALQPLPSRNGGPLPVVEHETDHLLQRLSRDGIEVPGFGNARLELDLTTAEKQSAGRWLKDNLPPERVNRVVGFGPGSKWPSKVWTEERFAQLRIEPRQLLVGWLLRQIDVRPEPFDGPIVGHRHARRFVGIGGHVARN